MRLVPLWVSEQLVRFRGRTGGDKAPAAPKPDNDEARLLRQLTQHNFEAYGRVMAKVGAFEQFLRIAIGQRELDREARGGKPVDPHAFARKVMNWDLATLCQQVCSRFQFDDDLRQAMIQCVDHRNDLAHLFWVTHFPHLRTLRGLNAIQARLMFIELEFERISAIAIQGAGIDAGSYIAYVHNRGLAEAGLDELEKAIVAAFQEQDAKVWPAAPPN